MVANNLSGTAVYYESLLERLTDRSGFTNPATSQQVDEADSSLGLRLPEALRHFVQRYGALSTRSEFNLFGLGCSRAKSPSVIWAKKYLSFTSNLPANLLPVGTVNWDVYACLELEGAGRVLEWRDGLPPERQELRVLAVTYTEFLEQISKEVLIYDQALTNLEKHVVDADEKNHYTNTGEGKLPRSQDWRVHRFCSRDIILGVLAVKHQMGANCLVVNLFLPIDLPPFEPGGSLIFMTLFILGDAYRCGGSMEIRFTRNVDGGQVPRKLQALASQVGAPIKPESLAQGRLDPDDSLRLYMALTSFSHTVLDHIQSQGINPLKACFVVHRGIWSKGEVEMLLLLSPHPERIFSGGPSPADWSAWITDLKFCRSVALASFLTRALARRLPDEGNEDMEDDNNEVAAGFVPEAHALLYTVSPPASHSAETIPVPWLAPGTSRLVSLSAGQEFLVMPRVRDRFELRAWFEQDMRQAAGIAAQSTCPVFLLLPRDFLDVHLDDLRPGWMEQASRQNTGLIICGEDSTALDEEVMRRWRASRIVRE